MWLSLKLFMFLLLLVICKALWIALTCMKGAIPIHSSSFNHMVQYYKCNIVSLTNQVVARGWSHTGSSPRCSHSEFSQTGCPEHPWRSASRPPSESWSCRHSTAPSPPTVRKMWLQFTLFISFFHFPASSLYRKLSWPSPGSSFVFNGQIWEWYRSFHQNLSKKVNARISQNVKLFVELRLGV